MRIDDPDLQFAPDAAFKYVSGDASLDLVNTVNWTERGLGRDRLTDYGRLVEWARGAGLLTPAAERGLRREAEAHPRAAAKAFARVLDARDVLQRTFAAATRKRLGASDLERVNELLAATVPPLRLERASDGRLAQGWERFGESLDSVLWAVTWRAGQLLISDEVDQLRICGGEECGWMYIDRSRNGLRRWCEMGVCGTTAKNRRRAAR